MRHDGEGDFGYWRRRRYLREWEQDELQDELLASFREGRALRERAARASRRSAVASAVAAAAAAVSLVFWLLTLLGCAPDLAGEAWTDGDPEGPSGCEPDEPGPWVLDADCGLVGRLVGELGDGLTLRVLDEARGLRFSVCADTGVVLGASSTLYFETPDCSGEPRVELPGPACPPVATPRFVFADPDGPPPSCTEPPAELWLPVSPALVTPWSWRTAPEGPCRPADQAELCGALLAPDPSLEVELPAPLRVSL